MKPNDVVLHNHLNRPKMIVRDVCHMHLNNEEIVAAVCVWFDIALCELITEFFPVEELTSIRI